MRAQNSRLVVFPPNWLGDSVMSLAAITALLAKLPENETIDLVCKPRVAEFWQLQPKIGNIFVTPVGFRDVLPFLTKLRAQNYELAYIFPRTWRAALLARFAGIQKIMGFKSASASFLYNETIDDSLRDREHLVSTYLRLIDAQLVGATNSPRFPAEVVQSLRQASKPCSTQAYICFIPGAARGPAKMWPREKYIDLGVQLVEKFSEKILILGSPAEAELCQQIASGIGAKAESLAGKTKLKDFAAQLAGANLVVCNDSGGMHLAAALETPLIAIFGETDPAITGPSSANAYVIQKSQTRSRKISFDSASAIAALAKVEVQDVLDLIEQKKIFSRA